MPSTCIDTADAIELAETLQLIARWLAADPERLAASLLAFIGHPAYGPDALRRPGPLRLPPRRQRRRAPVRRGPRLTVPARLSRPCLTCSGPLPPRSHSAWTDCARMPVAGRVFCVTARYLCSFVTKPRPSTFPARTRFRVTALARADRPSTSG